MISSLINRPCTLIRRSETGGEDEFGNESLVETLVAAVCEIQQRRRTEPGGQGELSVADWDGFFLAGTALDTGDAVRVPGLGDFEVVGAPWPARDPDMQSESHVEASLRRTAGAEDTP